jgi:beta-lactam-binding protein with PASTA domain
VIAQNPQQGAAGVERPSVSLLVSSPVPDPAPALVMPQLIGMPLATAAALLCTPG